MDHPYAEKAENALYMALFEKDGVFYEDLPLMKVVIDELKMTGAAIQGDDQLEIDTYAKFLEETEGNVITEVRKLFEKAKEAA